MRAPLRQRGPPRPPCRVSLPCPPCSSSPDASEPPRARGLLGSSSIRSCSAACLLAQSLPEALVEFSLAVQLLQLQHSLVSQTDLVRKDCTGNWSELDIGALVRRHVSVLLHKYQAADCPSESGSRQHQKSMASNGSDQVIWSMPPIMGVPVNWLKTLSLHFPARIAFMRPMEPMTENEENSALLIPSSKKFLSATSCPKTSLLLPLKS